jgi:hypothetical protein
MTGEPTTHFTTTDPSERKPECGKASARSKFTRDKRKVKCENCLRTKVYKGRKK